MPGATFKPSLPTQAAESMIGPSVSPDAATVVFVSGRAGIASLPR